MADNRVTRYIKEGLMHGHSVSSIKKYLLSHHHKEEEVNEAISQVSVDYENGLIHP